MGLQRRFDWQANTDMLIEAAERIKDLVEGLASCGGYRSMWHTTLRMEGIQVPRSFVENMLNSVDPEGCRMRQAHRLRRRAYHNPGPNYACHADGYDKLKPFGFSIHGTIDGYSRKVLWLDVSRSNKCPRIVAAKYIGQVVEANGCPVQVITDLGTENGLLAPAQCFFRDSLDAHRYVSSPRNQRIENWWSHLCRFRTSWWRNLFCDLEFQGLVDYSQDLHKECLWYCFSEVLQRDLSFVKQHWNSHRIRKSRHDTIAGRPDVIYSMPERYGGLPDLLKEVPPEKIQTVSEEIALVQDKNEYEEYFDHLRTGLSLDLPTEWQEAIHLYEELIRIAVG